jgi:hypothetical protein
VWGGSGSSHLDEGGVIVSGWTFVFILMRFWRVVPTHGASVLVGTSFSAGAGSLGRRFGLMSSC